MSPTVELTWDQVLSWRMDRHFLDRPRGVDPVQIVGRLSGVQAQVASSAELALAVRRAEREADVAGALFDRSLVKTWAMRGTLHLLRSEDAPAYLSLIASARTWLTPSWQREFATATQMEAIADAASAVLKGAVLTREELAREIAERTGDRPLADKLTSGWGALLKPLAWQGLLCNGISRGNRVTFTSPTTWLPTWKGLPEPDEAARAAIPAYLAAHGPAGPSGFNKWLTRGALRKLLTRRWFAELAEDGVLTPVRVEDETLYARTDDLDTLTTTTPTDRVRFLPGFDQYVLGPGTNDHRVLATARRGWVSRAAGWIAPIVVSRGQVAGTWKIDGSSLFVELFAESDPVARDAIEAERGVLEDALGERLTTSVVEV
ncbi:winged helix DNA-binding domain-containing protein [Nonomuraea sp. NPDC049480]|uniref:winged helix DNA-binding domain-containing protein n=1 Tax=Nonomuraea sp. NPDC049480 TaxID=3364353 RepID=UPI0037959EDC